MVAAYVRTHARLHGRSSPPKASFYALYGSRREVMVVAVCLAKSDASYRLKLNQQTGGYGPGRPTMEDSVESKDTSAFVRPAVN